MADDQITLAEAAGIVGFPRRTLERWVLSGDLAGTVGEDGQVTVSRREIERMVEWQQREP